MMTEGNANVIKRGVVKQVLSGDAIILLGPPSAHGPPPEMTVYLSNVTAPRLAKRPNESGNTGSDDEPFAWEAREFLRKKVVGQPVNFVRDFLTTAGREHGRLYLGGTSIETAENVSETGVSEGWLEVRPGKQADEYTQKLLDLQEKAKVAKKGKWAYSESEYSQHVRNIKWQVTDAKSIVEKYHLKPVKAVIEQVRDGSTVRAFLLPSFEYVTINLSGIKTPSPKITLPAEPYGEEAKFFVEQRILQRDVEVVLESVANNQNFLGSVLHPKGNIAVFLLKDGYAKTSWSITLATAGVQTMREAEKFAQEKRLRLWTNFTASTASNRKVFEATVVEIGLGDSVIVEKENGEETKLHLSSIRPPRKDSDAPTAVGGRKFLPLYDIPYMFEAREFLRKTLLGKRVKVTIDYIQPKSDQYPEKVCATININGENVAVKLLEQGLAKIIRHRQDDENRSFDYDSLMVAEGNAEKEKKGLFSDKKPVIRVQEIQGDASRANQFINYLKKGGRNDGVVEFIASASRLRVYVPKETVVFTFLLGGITAPKTARQGPGGKVIGESEPFAEEALKLTKKYAFQREVKVEVDTTDKNGAYIGFMFVKKENGSWANLSEILLENGLASLHFSAEKSSYYPSLAQAEKFAKEAKRGIWHDYVEEENAAPEIEHTTETTERKVSYKKVCISEIVPDTFRFYAQYFEDGDAIVKLMKELQEINSATEGTIKPKKNELVAVKFSNQYHRAKVESIKGDVADVLYVDYGNREQIDPKKIAPLPAKFQAHKPLAHEYVLALTKLPNADYVRDAYNAFADLAFSHQSMLLNIEYKSDNVEAVSLTIDDENKKDVAKTLIQEGYALVDIRREKRLSQLLEQYTEAENQARKAHINIWQYGDARADD